MLTLWIEIYKEAPGRRRECLYYLALGQFKLGHYNEARRYNDSLLEKEPRNMQALSLRALIDDRVAKGTKPLSTAYPFSFRTLSAYLFRGIRRNGYCGECCYWVYCCCGNVGSATVTRYFLFQYKSALPLKGLQLTTLPHT